MPVWLVTGGSGFLGRHLLAKLGERPSPSLDLVAIGRKPPPGWKSGEYVPVDLLDPEAVIRVVGAIGPSVVFHLAGRTPPAMASDLYAANMMATIHLLDALRASGRTVRVVLVGSAAELGPVPVEKLPVGEGFPCQPADPYGMSKMLASVAGLASRPPLDVVVARVFNPIGPGLSTSQALGRFAEALARSTGPLLLKVGDLEARRDFVDVRDVALALIALADRGSPGRIYHVGTGRSHRVGDGLERLISLSGRDVVVESDPAIARNRGPGDSRADVRRIQEEVGWSAAIPWDQSLCDLWADVVERSGRG